jgi:zinc/manganese transport system ATP-binding protein/zinc transport system ATP-binding protein
VVFTEKILNETYQGDMLVMRHENMIFVHQRPHGHTYHDLLPNPVLGHPTNATAFAPGDTALIVNEIDTMLQGQPTEGEKARDLA